MKIKEFSMDQVFGEIQSHGFSIIFILSSGEQLCSKFY